MLLIENKSSRQKPPIPNFECLELQSRFDPCKIRTTVVDKDEKKNINLLHGYMKLNSIIWQFSSRSDDLHVPVTKKYSSLQCWFLHHMSVRHLERDLYERSGFYIRGPGTTVHLTVHLVFSVTPFK